MNKVQKEYRYVYVFIQREFFFKLFFKNFIVCEKNEYIWYIVDFNDNELGEDGNVFFKTGVLIIKSSFGSSGGLMVVFRFSYSSNESDDCQLQDSISFFLDGSIGVRDLLDNEVILFLVFSYYKVMVQFSIKNQFGVSFELELENIIKNEKDNKSNKKEQVFKNNNFQLKFSVMSFTL